MSPIPIETFRRMISRLRAAGGNKFPATRDETDSSRSWSSAVKPFAETTISPPAKRTLYQPIPPRVRTNRTTTPISPPAKWRITTSPGMKLFITVNSVSKSAPVWSRSSPSLRQCFEYCICRVLIELDLDFGPVLIRKIVQLFPCRDRHQDACSLLIDCEL